MKIVVEVFGRGIAVDVCIGWGFFSLTLGRHLDVLMNDDGTRGRLWFDWVGGDGGSFEVWLGRHHIIVGLGPALACLAPKAGTERALQEAS